MNKCILTYGLDQAEINGLKASKIKVVEIKDSMTKMKVLEILEGKVEEAETNNDFKNEKIIVFNNIPDAHLHMLIGVTKKVIKKRPILATVTETSKDWTFEYLVEHLLEEREWHKTNKGSAMHEQE